VTDLLRGQKVPAMRINDRLSRVLALMALVAMAFLLAPSGAEAHAGHAQAAAPIGHGAAHGGYEAVPVGAVEVVPPPPSSEQPATLCTTNCCAAGMSCCVALGAVPDGIDPPQARLVRHGPLNAARAGVEPAVPLKPPRRLVARETRDFKPRCSVARWAAPSRPPARAAATLTHQD
jgi:hypothetical protein